MKAEQRRAAILAALETADEPLSASALATAQHVSRQIIVGDVALLRAGGVEISATPRGYVLASTQPGLLRRVACRHDGKEMERELLAIVDAGCTVLDVIVEHPIYGQLTGTLALACHGDVSEFCSRCGASRARPLSDLTGGIHLHTLSCPDEAAFERARDALRALGVLLEN